MTEEHNLEFLKAHAYDCISNIETWQKELQATNAKITAMINAENTALADTTSNTFKQGDPK